MARVKNPPLVNPAGCWKEPWDTSECSRGPLRILKNVFKNRGSWDVIKGFAHLGLIHLDVRDGRDWSDLLELLGERVLQPNVFACLGGKLYLYLEDGDIAVKENAKVCFGCSMIKSLTPDCYEMATTLNLQCFDDMPQKKTTSWSHRHSSWDRQGWCRGFLR